MEQYILFTKRLKRKTKGAERMKKSYTCPSCKTIIPMQDKLHNKIYENGKVEMCLSCKAESKKQGVNS